MPSNQNTNTSHIERTDVMAIRLLNQQNLSIAQLATLCSLVRSLPKCKPYLPKIPDQKWSYTYGRSQYLYKSGLISQAAFPWAITTQELSTLSRQSPQRLHHCFLLLIWNDSSSFVFASEIGSNALLRNSSVMLNQWTKNVKKTTFHQEP